VKAKPFLFLGLVAMCTISLVACKGEPVKLDHLYGVWKTSEPKFAGCKIEIRQGVLILGLKNGAEECHTIRKIESAEEDGPPVWYTIHYKDSEGQKSKLTFLYHPSFGGILQLKNRPEIWERTG
jgi:hypothetical protein